MTKDQFDILYSLFHNPGQARTKISAQAGMPPERAGRVFLELEQLGWVNEDGITATGMAELDRYKIRNAIILAAGMSSRFVPLSLERPKGLIVVKGETMIERQIRQLKEAGIDDITVIVGYMKEKYFFLHDRFGATLVENRDYAVKNNTSSLMLVLDKLQNTYLCASDHYFSENVFTSHSYTSNYTVKLIHGCSTDYSYSLDETGRFRSLRTWSRDEWGLVGPCCFLEQDARIFADHLRKEYEKPDTASKLWEEVMIGCIGEISLYPRRFGEGVIYEFDNLEELRMFDKDYINNLDSQIIRNICQVLRCPAGEVKNIEPVKAGLTNTSFQFDCGGARYVYRHPGAGTKQFLHRDCEAYAEGIARSLGLDDSFIEMDASSGWKISHLIEDARYIDPYDREDQLAAMRMLRALHEQKVRSRWEFDFIQQAGAYIGLMEDQGLYDFSPYAGLHEQMKQLDLCMKKEGFEKVLCHNDTWYWNFLKDGQGKLYLIDWEYAGNAYPAADVADYTISLEFDGAAYMKLAELYEGHPLSEKEKRLYWGSLAIVAWHWFVWGLYKEAAGTVIDDLRLWYQKARDALKIARGLYGSWGG